MADENKSFFPNIGLLSDSSLTGLAPELQDQLQREATKRMVLGGLLSGRADVGFQSAIGVPTDYFARQNAIQAQQQQQQLLGARNASYERVGLPYVPGSEQEKMLAQDVQDFGPDAARTYAALESNRNLPKKFNAERYAGLASEILAGSDPAKWAEFNKNIRPYTQEGNTYQTSPLTGKREFLPGMEKGEEPVFDRLGNVIGVRNMEGKISAVSQRAVAEQGAQSMFNLEPVKLPDGTTVLQRKSDITGYTTPGSFAPNEPSAVAPNQPKPVAKPVAPQAGNQPQIPGFVPGVDIAPRQNPLVASIKEQAPAVVARQESWKQMDKDAYDSWKQTQKHSSALQSLQNIMNRPDFDTNAFSGYKGQIIAILNAAKIATDKQQQFLTSQTGFRQAVNDFAVNAVSELSGATSDRDIQFGKERFIDIKDTKAANQYALDLMVASDKRKQDYYNFIHNNPDPDAIQKWQQSDQGKASIFESPSMRKYLPQSVIQSGEYKGQTAYKMPDGTVKVFPK